MIAKRHSTMVTAFVGMWVALGSTSRAQAQPAVVITEFMASNQTTIADEDGEFSDWIEIQNLFYETTDLSGWYLTDSASNLQKWQFPPVTLSRGDTLLVFASDKNRAVAGSELHTNFKLEAAGEFLALVRPDGTTIAHAHAPQFPAQYPDISYGVAQSSVTLVARDSQVTYHVPTSGDSSLGSSWSNAGYNDATWSVGELGLGFLSGLPPQFQVTWYKSTIPVTDLATAEAVISDPATQAQVHVELSPTVNYLNTGAVGHYGSDRPFPGTTIGVNTDDFVVEATTSVVIPTAGAWTFGVNSDDGFGLELTNDPYAFGSSFQGTRGPGDTLAAFSVPQAGNYQLRLVSFDRTGGSSVELFAAPGSFGSFSSLVFDLVGDVANGGLAVVGAAGDVKTDVGPLMQGVNASVWLRKAFDVSSPGAIESLFLNARYEDGFAVFLNGTALTGRNAPVALAWNSTAAADRPSEQGQVFERVDLTQHLAGLVVGSNVLGIHALNDTAASTSFWITPELVGLSPTNLQAAPKYFTSATPRAYNNDGYSAVSGPVQMSPPSGFFTSPVSVTLSTPNPGAAIRYTLNGTNPSETVGTLYSGPIAVSNSAQVRARAFETGLAPGPIAKGLYSMLSPDILTASSDLPLVIVDTFSQAVTQNWLTLSQTTFIDTVGGRADLNDPSSHMGPGGIKIRGSSSTGFPKRQYHFEVWDSEDHDLSVSLLGLPPESDWVLYGPYTDKTLMRDALAYRWSNAIGRYAPRTRYFEMYLDMNGGSISAADYVGVYALIEKVKTGPDRVAITPLSPDDNAVPEITGGYLIKKDRLDPGDAGFLTASGQRLAYVAPKETEITAAQATYLKAYLDEFEGVLNGANYADPINGYAKYIDVDSFIDHHILVEMTKNIDGFRLSTFMYKDRNAKLTMGPAWDYNLTLGNANYLEGWLPQGWYNPQLSDTDYPWWRRLFTDPEFQLRYADRWFEFRRGPLDASLLVADIDELAAVLAESQVRNYVRWPILGVYVWPNWYIGLTFADEVSWMRQWLIDRLTWIDTQFPAPPTFTPQGGTVDYGSEMAISAPQGTVYFTVDGADPRLPGGTVAPSAQTYVGPVTLFVDTQLKARILDAGAWSAINDAMFDIVPPAHLNEVAVAHTGAPLDEAGDADPWIELYNSGTATADLSGLFLSDEPGNPFKWAFPSGTTLCGRSWLLVWADAELGEGPLHSSVGLQSVGGSIGLFDETGQALDALAYPALTAGESFGRFPDGAPTAETFKLPTPLGANEDNVTVVFLNEYNAVSPANFLGGSSADSFWGTLQGNGGDWLELVVAEDHADLRGWQLVITNNTGVPSQTVVTLTFSAHAIWSDLRSGTIITVSENLADDVSYNPELGDWWINVRADAPAPGTYITNQGFEVSQQNSQVLIRDALGRSRFGPAGEGVIPASGVGSDEVFKLEENPTVDITATSTFRDGTSSTFGSPNVWSSGSVTQDFSLLRSVVLQACTMSSECDDGNACTDDACIGNVCEHSVDAGTCNDGDACTSGDACVDGVCVGSVIPDCCHVDCDCDDGDPCTTEACISNACVPSVVAGPCDDGDACTTNDACMDGDCVGGSQVECVDGNLCTDDSCDPGTGCVFANNSAPCDDGNVCTTVDSCVGGGCVGGLVDPCDDGNVCTTDSCTPFVGCQQVANSNACSDGNGCTTGDTCVGGTCVGGPPMNCADGNPCTTDVCTVGVCSNPPVSCPVGSSCNPGNGLCESAPVAVTFQQGVGGYTGAKDTFLNAATPAANNAAATTLVVDLAPSVQQILLEFGGIFGSGAGQIPSGATIQSATLTIFVTNGSTAGASLHRMLQAWNDSDNWNTFASGGAGIQAGTETAATADVSSLLNIINTPHNITVTNSVQTWHASPSTNFGWAWLPPAADDSWQFSSSEGTTAANRPRLSVTYVASSAPADPPTALAVGSRYLSVTPPAGQPSVALRVESASIACLPRYVDASGLLSDTPVFQSSAAWGTVFVGDREIIPSTAYQVRADVRAPLDPVNLSTPVSTTTWLWGDTNNVDGVNLFDIICVLDGFQDSFANCTAQAVDLQDATPSRDVDLFDIVAVLDSFQSLPYPDGTPCAGFFAVAAAEEDSGQELTLSLRSSTASVSAGDIVVVDVFADGADALRGYQIALDATSRTPGAITMGEVGVDDSRSDYVFGEQLAFPIGDRDGIRLANALPSGAVAMTGRAYLGSFEFVIGAKASGWLQVSVRLDETIALDADNLPMAVMVEGDLTLRVEALKRSSKPSAR